MTKQELVDRAAEQANVSKRTADEVITATFEGIAAAIISGEGINIQGIGTFARKYRKARKGRNPQTGDPVDIPAKYVTRFKVSKQLNAKLN